MQVIVWNLASRKEEMRMVAHERSVKGMVYEPTGEHLLTVGDDKTIKIWKSFKDDEDEAVMPTNTIICKVCAFI